MRFFGDSMAVIWGLRRGYIGFPSLGFSVWSLGQVFPSSGRRV